jgi:hypothetical protein
MATQPALVFIVGCSGKGTPGPTSATGGAAGFSRETGAGPSITGGNAGGDSGSPSTNGVAGGAFGSGGVSPSDTPVSGGGSAGATTGLGGAGTSGRSSTGGTIATAGNSTGGGLGIGGSTGGGSAGMAGGGTAGTSGLGGVTQGGVSGTNTVVECTSTTCASRDDGGMDGASAECGEPVTKACYAACRESKDEASCSERGGTWRIKLSSTEGTCVCPTGEGGRPCTASSDCLDRCRAWMDPMQGSEAWCQQYVTSFTCSPEGGQPGFWCIPEFPFAICDP